MKKVCTGRWRRVTEPHIQVHESYSQHNNLERGAPRSYTYLLLHLEGVLIAVAIDDQLAASRLQPLFPKWIECGEELHLIIDVDDHHSRLLPKSQFLAKLMLQHHEFHF